MEEESAYCSIIAEIFNAYFKPKRNSVVRVDNFCKLATIKEQFEELYFADEQSLQRLERRLVRYSSSSSSSSSSRSRTLDPRVTNYSPFKTKSKDHSSEGAGPKGYGISNNNTNRSKTISEDALKRKRLDLCRVLMRKNGIHRDYSPEILANIYKRLDDAVLNNLNLNTFDKNDLVDLWLPFKRINPTFTATPNIKMPSGRQLRTRRRRNAAHQVKAREMTRKTNLIMRRLPHPLYP